MDATCLGCNNIARERVGHVPLRLISSCGRVGGWVGEWAGWFYVWRVGEGRADQLLRPTKELSHKQQTYRQTHREIPNQELPYPTRPSVKLSQVAFATSARLLDLSQITFVTCARLLDLSQVTFGSGARLLDLSRVAVVTGARLPCRKSQL